MNIYVGLFIFGLLIFVTGFLLLLWVLFVRAAQRAKNEDPTFTEELSDFKRQTIVGAVAVVATVACDYLDKNTLGFF